MLIKPNQRSSRGFTLVELMVAVAITTVIITVLITITGIATDTYSRSRSEIRASRQAKAALEQMAKDFESMVSRQGNSFEWLHAAMDTSGGLPTVVRDQTGDTEAAALTFLTAATDRYLGQVGTANDNGGDVSCVSYKLTFQDPIDGSQNQNTSTFVLYRLLVDPDDTFTDLLGQDDLQTSFDAGYGSEVTDEENFICENVHQFTMTFIIEKLNTDTDELENHRVTLSSDGGTGEFRVFGDGLEGTSIDGEDISTGRLKSVEISLSVLSDVGIARMGDTGLTDDDYARNVYHYSRVVELPSP